MKVPINKNLSKDHYPNVCLIGEADIPVEECSDLQLAYAIYASEDAEGWSTIFSPTSTDIFGGLQYSKEDTAEAIAEWQKRVPRKPDYDLKWWAKSAQRIVYPPSPEELAREQQREREWLDARIERIRKSLARWVSGKAALCDCVGYADLAFLSKQTGSDYRAEWRNSLVAR